MNDHGKFAAGFGGGIGNDEDWGGDVIETFGRARQVFRSLGIGGLLTIEQVERLAEADPGSDLEFWSFGYGDEPDWFTTISWDELSESIEEDGADVTMAVWGPFILKGEWE